MSGTWPIGPTYPMLPNPSGYTCTNCGAWVYASSFHSCHVPTTTGTTATLKGAEVSDYELKQIGEIVEGLKNARRAFDSLDSDAEPRVVEFLASRFGADQDSLIQVLVEEK